MLVRRRWNDPAANAIPVKTRRLGRLGYRGVTADMSRVFRMFSLVLTVVLRLGLAVFLRREAHGVDGVSSDTGLGATWNNGL